MHLGQLERQYHVERSHDKRLLKTGWGFPHLFSNYLICTMNNIISLVSLFDNNAKITLNPFRVVNRDEYYLLISPETGAWATLPKSDKKVLSQLQNAQTIDNVVNQSDPQLSNYLDELFYCGLIQVNGKDVTMTRKKESDNATFPYFWVLKYTNACNLRCSYCYSYDKNKKNRLDLPNEYIYKIAKLAENNNKDDLCLCFHGGEPLIRFKDIVKCVEGLRQQCRNDLKFAIQTNGTLLTREIANYLKKEKFSVGISLDGYDAETNKLRPFANHRSSINKTMDAIRNCVDSGITPGIISVMTNNIYDKSIEIMENLYSIGVPSFHFNHFFPSGRGQDKEKDFALTTTEILNTRIKMLLFINDFNESKEKKDHISERFSSNIIKSLVLMGNMSYMCAQSPCGAGKKTLTINGEGDIFPCDDLGTDKHFKIANINEIEDLKTTLSNSMIVKECQNHCINNIPKCQECLYKKLCISHCCSDSYHYTGKFNSPHSACEFIQQFIPTVIDLLYKGRIKVENIID